MEYNDDIEGFWGGMLDKDGKAVADRLMEKLKGGGFIKSSSQNHEEDYIATKQERDSIAVAEFVGTDLFQDIMAMR
ncbi:MAG: hypothetical protein LBV17_09915 [Treponema sp.]|nr:hypothetical protein [Treponema sp.]